MRGELIHELYIWWQTKAPAKIQPTNGPPNKVGPQFSGAYNLIIFFQIYKSDFIYILLFNFSR